MMGDHRKIDELLEWERQELEEVRSIDAAVRQRLGLVGVSDRREVVVWGSPEQIDPAESLSLEHSISVEVGCPDKCSGRCWASRNRREDCRFPELAESYRNEDGSDRWTNRGNGLLEGYCAKRHDLRWTSYRQSEKARKAAYDTDDSEDW